MSSKSSSKSASTKGTGVTKEAQPKLSIEKERSQFKELLLSNPNYFGNLADSSFASVKKIIGNTTYEQLTCVGFNPDSNQLEATINIKLPVGYGGSLCGAGTQEYVRFFLDYGSGWEDNGVAAINVHDIPNKFDCAQQSEKPLTYVVTLKIDPKRNICDRPVLPNVRAILSWQMVPQAGNPNWPPVWGNVHECPIQIKPRRKFILDLIDLIGLQVKQPIKLPPEYHEAAQFPIPLPDPPPFSIAELAQLYQGATGGKAAQGAQQFAVEPHRFGLSDLHAALTAPAFDQAMIVDKTSAWKSLGLDLQAAISMLAKTNADVSYEQLECLGLDNNLERLVANFRIKRPAGYSSDLCHSGSLEYVAFWADWDDTCEWEYLGTTTVNVHDISTIPKEGLCYSAILPADLTYHKRACKDPKIARVRAVLSWSIPPSATDPDALTAWGNRLDAHVQINPGPVLNPGDVMPILNRVGGISVVDIYPPGPLTDLFKGLTRSTAKFRNGFPPDGAGRTCPFAGRVIIEGPPFPGFTYRIQAKKVGELVGMTVAQPMTLQPLFGPSYTKSPIDAAGFFTYETLFNNPDMTLAWWDTAGDDLWEITLEIPGHGEFTQTIQLKNSGVEDVRIHIDSGGDCKDFPVGIKLTGRFVARDPYLGSYELSTLPFAAPDVQLSPTGGSMQTALTPPPGGATWTLDTTNMRPCGYVVVVSATDRAIINSSGVGHSSDDSTGFCLRS